MQSNLFASYFVYSVIPRFTSSFDTRWFDILRLLTAIKSNVTDSQEIYSIRKTAFKGVQTLFDSVTKLIVQRFKL